MENKTEQALQILAEKLGTTTEYLWGILLVQAKWDILTSCIQMVCMIIFIWYVIRLHLKLMKPIEGERYYDSLYEKYDPGAAIGMVFAGIMCGIFVITFLSGFNELIAAIFNPEYWALRQIMHLIH